MDHNFRIVGFDIVDDFFEALRDPLIDGRHKHIDAPDPGQHGRFDHMADEAEIGDSNAVQLDHEYGCRVPIAAAIDP